VYNSLVSFTLILSGPFTTNLPAFKTQRIKPYLA